MARLVVVGHGMAATRLLEELVARGTEHEITVVGDEPGTAYNRILLSAVLEGTHGEDALPLRDTAWHAEHGITLLTGARVGALDRAAGEVELVDGRRLSYDRLVLATGSNPVVPPAFDLHRVHTFRSLADCRRLLRALPDARRAVVVGGGLLGLQVARALAVRGMLTEVVETGEHLLRSQVGPRAGQVLARSLTRLGTAVYLGARAARLTEAGVLLDNGYELETDLVVVAAGTRPAVRLARDAGLSVRRGVVVDDLLTSVDDPHVLAIGDCAEHRGRTTGYVAPAWEQATALAAQLAGAPDRYTGSRLVARLRATDLDVAVLGDPEHAEGDVVEVSNPVAGSHRKLVVREGRLVAASLVGDLTRVGLLTQHFDRGTVLGATEPGALLLPDRPQVPQQIADDAEVCACAGVTAARIRACSSVEDARRTTRAGTGCGGCAATVRQIIATREGQPA